MRVRAKLDENKRNQRRPANIEQLRKMVDAKKNSLDQLLKLDRDPPQLTCTYTDAICEVLEIEPPLIEQDDDDEEFIKDVRLLRSLTVEARRALMSTAKMMDKKAK